MFGEVQQVCHNTLITVPTERISANQIIQALISFIEGRTKIELTWHLAISEVPILDSQQTGLKSLYSDLVRELNAVRGVAPESKESLVARFVDIERVVWKDTLKVYFDIIAEEKRIPEEIYAEFYLTDYFTDLPFVVLRSYLLAYVFNEREIRIQDLVDIFTISTLMPYATLFIMDRDQHNRIRRLEKDYPVLFDRLDEFCYISSFLRCNSLSPRKALHSLLLHMMSRRLTS